MVDTQLLEQKIADSGLKIVFVCNQLGISYNSFYKKSHNMTKFRTAEIFVLCHILNLSEEEKELIFFAHKVHK